jgi:hypothetical protein
LSDRLSEELQEAIVCEVLRFGLVKKQNIDEVCPKEAQTGFERRTCLLSTELRFLRRRSDCAGRTDETPLQRRDALGYRADDSASCTERAAALGRSDPVLGGDGRVAVMLEELAETAFGFAVSVHRRDIEVTNAGDVGRFQQTKALAAIERAHNGGASVAKLRCRPTVIRKRDLLHKLLRFLD